jgi:hypothetical protein
VEIIAFVLVIGGFVTAFTALGWFIGYQYGVRRVADTYSQALLDAIPALAQRIELTFRTQRLEVPVTVTARVQVPEVEPISVPVVTLPAPSNLDLAVRILAEVGSVGPRPLARILDIAPPTAHAMLKKIAAEDLVAQAKAYRGLAPAEDEEEQA